MNPEFARDESLLDILETRLNSLKIPVITLTPQQKLFLTTILIALLLVGGCKKNHPSDDPNNPHRTYVGQVTSQY